MQSSLIKSDFNKARVSFNVAQFKKETQLVPIHRVNFPQEDSLVLGNQVLEVSYWLRRDESKVVQPEDFRLVADFNVLNKADSTITIRLEQRPPFVSDIRVNRANIRVYEIK